MPNNLSYRQQHSKQHINCTSRALSRNNSATFSRTATHVPTQNGISYGNAGSISQQRVNIARQQSLARRPFNFHKTIHQNPRKLQNRDQTNVASATNPIPFTGCAIIRAPARFPEKLPGKTVPARNLVSNICVAVWPMFAPRSIADGTTRVEKF